VQVTERCLPSRDIQQQLDDSPLSVRVEPDKVIGEVDLPSFAEVCQQLPSGALTGRRAGMAAGGVLQTAKGSL